MDLLLDDNNDLVIERYDLQLVTGLSLIKQRLTQRFRFYFNEWYLATNEGVPYFEEILIKGPDRVRVESILKSTIVETEGVTSLTAFELDYNNETRSLSLVFSCETDQGLIEEMEITL